MVFNSYAFVMWFFPIFLIVWHVSPRREWVRLTLLLFASYYFYAWWDYRFTVLIVLVTVVNFLAGRMISSARSKRTSRLIMSACVFFNLVPLFFFKYLPWLGSYITAILPRSAGDEYAQFLSGIVLPVGISFFTFQAMSYTIDIFRGEGRLCGNFLKFAVYVSMFPQLLAGPISRFGQICYQLDGVSNIHKGADFKIGTELFFRGLIKKVIFADQISSLIDASFGIGAELSTGLAWASILGYSLQIYFDFSGYTDMAIGVGKMIGFQLPDNFRAPYAASNPTEFWRRWHISLSTWLRDYLYISLGGNRTGQSRTYFNLMLTMLLGGLWHGANWTFLLWGAWHGVLLIVHRATPKKVKNLVPSWVGVLLLNLCIIIGWVFFRSAGVQQSFAFLSRLAGSGNVTGLKIPLLLLVLIIGGYALHLLEAYELKGRIRGSKVYMVFLSLLSILAVLELGQDSPFIYFKF